VPAAGSPAARRSSGALRLLSLLSASDGARASSGRASATGRKLAPRKTCSNFLVLVQVLEQEIALCATAARY
jgi:hypothetical protein